MPGNIPHLPKPRPGPGTPLPPGPPRSPFPRERGCQLGGTRTRVGGSQGAERRHRQPGWSTGSNPERKTAGARRGGGCGQAGQRRTRSRRCMPEACREALGGCSHLCEPHPAGPCWAGNASSHSSRPARPRLQRRPWRGPGGCKPHGAGRGTRSSTKAGRPNNKPPSCGKLQMPFYFEGLGGGFPPPPRLCRYLSEDIFKRVRHSGWS